MKLALRPFLRISETFRQLYSINPKLFICHLLLIVISSLFELIFLTRVPRLVQTLIAETTNSPTVGALLDSLDQTVIFFILLAVTTFFRSFCLKRNGYVSAQLTAKAVRNYSNYIINSQFFIGYRTHDYSDIVENSTVTAMNLSLYVIRPIFDFLYSLTQALAIVASIFIFSGILAATSLSAVLIYLCILATLVYPKLSKVKHAINDHQSNTLVKAQSLFFSKRHIALDSPYAFSQAIESSTYSWLQAHADNSFYASIPRVFLELAVFGAAASIFIILVASGSQEASVFIASVSVLGVAAARFFSIAQQLFSSLSTLKAFSSALKIITIPNHRLHAKTDSYRKNPIVIRNTIEYSFRITDLLIPSAPRLSVTPLSLTIPYRGLVALVGPSGSGKSSLIDLLIGFNVNHVGSVEVSNSYSTQSSLSQSPYLLNAAYCSSTNYFCSDSITEVIQNPLGIPYESPISEHRLNILLSASCLTDRYGVDLNQPVSSLSQGQRQRLALASALSREKPLLILDEALSSVDSKISQTILSNLRTFASLQLVILVTHRQSDVTVCDASIAIGS